MSLFNLGSILATLPADVHPNQARITAADSEQLEREIDRMNEGPARAAIIRIARRFAASTPNCTFAARLPPRGTHLASPSRDRPVGQLNIRYLNRLERCAVCLEAGSGQSSARSAGNALGTQSGCVAKGNIGETHLCRIRINPCPAANATRYWPDRAQRPRTPRFRTRQT